MSHNLEDNLIHHSTRPGPTDTQAVRNRGSFSRRYAFRVAGLTVAGAAAVAAAGAVTTPHAAAAETPAEPAPECVADLFGGN